MLFISVRGILSVDYLVIVGQPLGWEKNKGMMEYAKINSVSIEGENLVINSTKIFLAIGEYERKLIRELLMQITAKEKERKREETKTEINLSETSFEPNVWKKIDLTIKTVTLTVFSNMF